MGYRITEQADFGLIYELEVLRYSPEKWAAFKLTRDDFIQGGKNLPSIGFEHDGRCIGGAFFHNHELHLSIHPDFHGRWGRLIWPLWEWMFTLENPVTCRVETDNLKCRQFGERSGWTQIAIDEKYVTFRASHEQLLGKHTLLGRRDQSDAVFRDRLGSDNARHG